MSSSFPPFIFYHFNVPDVSVTHTGKSRQQIRKGFLKCWLSQGDCHRLCSCRKGSFNHNMDHNLGNRHFQWVDIPVSTKPVPGGLHLGHFRCIIWVLPLVLTGKVRQLPLSSVNTLHTDFSPVQTGYSLRSNLLCVWIFMIHSHL